MSSESIAIIAATLLGPVMAIIVSEIIRSRTEARDRKMHVFRTLMATRRVAISVEHVNALNQIEVEFYGSESINRAWSEYIAHLNDPSSSVDQWWLKKEKLLPTLLHKMANQLGYKFDSIEIFQGGYAPVAWQTREDMQLDALRFLNRLSKSETSVPISVRTD